MSSEYQVIDEVYDGISSFIHLYESYLNARKNKRYRQDVIDFTNNLEHNLIVLQQELLNGTYHVGPYHRFYVYEPKLRMVMSIQFRDRVVQWAIYSVLYPFYDKLFIEDSYACRRDKGSHKAVDRLQYWMRSLDRKPGKWYYLKLDIHKYFYKIDHSVLMEILERRIKDERLLNLLKEIICNSDTNFGLPEGLSIEECTIQMMLSDIGMPIGNLTSQLFANIYLNELDQYCKHELHIKYYIRYMDDVIILGQDPEYLNEIKNKIEQFLNEILKLSLNNKTTINLIEDGIYFVGYRVYPTHKKLRRTTARRIIRSITHLCKNYELGIITKDDLMVVIQAYSNILDYCDSHGLSVKLARIYTIYCEDEVKFMSADNIKFSESATVYKYNDKEEEEMNKDMANWKCDMRIEKYNNDQSYEKGEPDEVLHVPGNTALMVGLQLLWKLANGQGDNAENYFLNAENTHIGVGNSSASANPAQTGLLGTSKYYKSMDQTTGVEYPIIDGNTITVRAKFGSTEANFVWNEWGVLNGDPLNPGNRSAASIVQFNRKVEAMGTKVAGSTWVIVADLSLNP